MTSILVTHDQDEALEVADRVVVMNQGRIEQIGTPDEVYDHPANPFVYDFLGNVNLFHGRIRNGQVHLGSSVFPLPEHETAPDRAAIAYVRPHEIKVTNQPETADSLPAIIRHVNSAGPIVHLELERAEDGSRFAADLPHEQSRQLDLRPGVEVFVELKKLRVFPDDYAI